ncbi:MAG: hypothetical protein EOR68_33845 [Mesorhizobium sp.]|uniref:hypothetical protein n=1 Tax=Mesorhizobium sp. TaxID=1871066 RepID=UPI000FE6A594|nr:hypothetical protein [Mesorhizobium sp.]RWL85754.1 MAG: hypothetical protein EOR68_33845 [Mesorhizobium sp.]
MLLPTVDKSLGEVIEDGLSRHADCSGPFENYLLHDEAQDTFAVFWLGVSECQMAGKFSASS